MEKHEPYFNLLDALKEKGCPVCFLLNKSTHKSMDDFLYESVNDPGLRQEIKASQGFCNRHAWQLQKFGDGFGQAIVYSDLMNIILKKLEEIDESLPIKEVLKKISPGTGKKHICIFCRQERDAEERYISVFWESFDDPEFSVNYKNSFGLCLPHIASALKKCRNKEFVKELIGIEAPKLSGLIGELKEFLRKHDYRFSNEKFGKEGDSWIRAIEKFIGKEGVF
ncbi:MAG: DUF6062 family protein [Candidatus Omnitrophica bacterium]|nr:DUF6062 family protein [Candidatus Omnitrophota bacterium]